MKLVRSDPASRKRRTKRTRTNWHSLSKHYLPLFWFRQSQPGSICRTNLLQIGGQGHSNTSVICTLLAHYVWRILASVEQQHLAASRTEGDRYTLSVGEIDSKSHSCILPTHSSLQNLLNPAFNSGKRSQRLQKGIIAHTKKQMESKQSSEAIDWKSYWTRYIHYERAEGVTLKDLIPPRTNRIISEPYQALMGNQTDSVRAEIEMNFLGK